MLSGEYRLEFSVGGLDTMAFYGGYLEVVPNERIVWTNDEGEEGAITTVTFEDRSGKTLLTFHEIYPTSRSARQGGSAAGLGGRLARSSWSSSASCFPAWANSPDRK